MNMKSLQRVSQSWLFTSLIALLILGAFQTKLVADVSQSPSLNMKQDGASMQTKPDGTQVFQDQEGSMVQINPDGSKLIKKSDGTSVQIKPDGTKIVIKPDGTKIEVQPGTSP
jgi:hypothetical protein